MAQSALRTAGAGLIGNVLEWFDFAVYLYFSREIGQHFFPEAWDADTKHMWALVVQWLGFVARGAACEVRSAGSTLA